MSFSSYAGNPGAAVAGPTMPASAPAPPPPPPPPPPTHPIDGQLPAMKIATSQATSAPRRTSSSAKDGYEPPAAIQNAMLTKDKKPFTYTPGMGGKLDLSQIRSPRMARRVAKNANDEGIEGPPKQLLEAAGARQPPSQNVQPFLQPQVAVPVFPVNAAPTSPLAAPTSRPAAINVVERPAEPAKSACKIEPRTTHRSNSPESPSTPTQVTLQKAPTPWLQNKNRPQEVVPEWARRSAPNKAGNATNKRPTSPTSPPQPNQSPPIYQQQQPERVIPIRIEQRPSVFSNKEDGAYQPPRQVPSAHHQQRWSQPVEAQQQPQQPQQPRGSFVVPIILEDADKRTTYDHPASSASSNARHPAQVNSPENFAPRAMQQQQQQQQQRERGGVKVAQTQQQEPGPLQSRSFRVLQKITDTDVPNDIDTEQMRKLQLPEEDKILMNKFKEQVDGDTYLHQEEDPRYRGAAIPSRAFRFLQNMTDSGEMSANATAPRPQNSTMKKQNRHSKSFEGTQANNVPASEQQVPEPRKYMGSAIPSRSFRILQAMTASENLATQGNHRADNTCQSENRVPGNQQGRYFPPSAPHGPNPHLPPIRHQPPPYWRADSSTWWDYYLVEPRAYVPYVETVNVHDKVHVNDPNNDNGYAYGYDYYPFCKHNCPLCSRRCENRCDDADRSARNDSPTRHQIEDRTKDWIDNPPNDAIGEEESTESVGVSTGNCRDNDCGEVVGDNRTDTDRMSTETICRTGLVDVCNDCHDKNDEDNDVTDNNGDNDDNDEDDSESVTDSESDTDSDSYLAYSTGLNPLRSRLPMTAVTTTTFTRENEASSEVMESTDCESDAEYEEEEANTTRNVVERNEPPDEDQESTVVTVSFPLRLKFSISESNEDVTTVIVGDSTAKRKRRTLSEDQEEIVPDATADFTFRKQTTVRESRLGKDVNDEDDDDDDDDNDNNESKLRLDGTLTEDSTATSQEDDGEKEVTFYVATTGINVDEDDLEKDKEDSQEEQECEERDFWAEINGDSAKQEERNEGFVFRPRVIVSDCDCTIADATTEDERKEVNAVTVETEAVALEVEEKSGEVEEKNGECEENERVHVIDEKRRSSEIERKDLLSVGNSREDTDDEDSGVTSDTSRMISEVDTDSECATTRQLSKYQRTQTHSRLFRLLYDDAMSTGETKREYLSLPLGSNAFSYDESSYCSNYSSGLTSPEYSPVSEQACRTRLQDPPTFAPEDSYFQAWKTSTTTTTSSPTPLPTSTTSTSTSTTSTSTDPVVVPSLAFGVVENKRPYWSYRVNVLCPRIKSSKNVPRAVHRAVHRTPHRPNGTTRDPPVIPTSYVKNVGARC